MNKNELIKNCILLNCIVYYDMLMPRDDRTLGEIIRLSQHTAKWQDMMLHSPVAMTGDKPIAVINEILGNEYLSGLVLKSYTVGRELESLKHVNKNNLASGGPIAICLKSQSTKEVIFVYRGTARYEWLDNADAFLKEASTLQLHALDFFNETILKNGYDKDYTIYVTGHSKGGNKAQFVTIASPYLVTECINFDGQGFSKQFCEKYADEIKAKASIITTIAAHSDYVSPLGNSIASSSIYYKTNQDGTDFKAKTPSGQALNILSHSGGLGALFNFLDAHSPGAVFHVEGLITSLNDKVAKPCLVSRHLSQLSSYIMNSCTNTDKKDCFYTIMSILSYTMNDADTSMVISDEEAIFSFDDVMRGLDVFISSARKMGFHFIALAVSLLKKLLAAAKGAASNAKSPVKYVETPANIPSKVYQQGLILRK